MALSPFVYWGQTGSVLTLRIDLKRTVNPIIELTERRLTFSGEGYGARGQNQYMFSIDFYDEIDPSDSFYRVIDRDIEFVVKKKRTSDWPQLLESGQKAAAWLKVDFEKMIDEESDSEATNENEVLDWRRTPNLMRNLKHKYLKDEGSSSPPPSHPHKRTISPEEFRKTYLFLYNLFQCVGFSYVLLVLSIRYAHTSPGPNRVLAEEYDVIGKAVKFVHLLKLLEILHPLLGYTKGDVLFPVIEIGCRFFLIFAVIDVEPELHSKPVTWNVFFIWSIADVIRHCYYMLRVFDVESPLTWVQYTAWILLYPLAFFCEGTLILLSITLFDRKERLPEDLLYDYTFSMSSILRIFLLFFYFPTFCMKAMRMYKKRKYRLRKKKAD